MRDDLARTCRRLDSLAVVDAALRAERVSEESLAVEVSRHDGLRGVGQARDVVPLADPRAECLQESQGRPALPVRPRLPSSPNRWRVDRERPNWLSAHGWTMRYFTDIDIYRRPHYVVSAMREALRRAGDSRPNPPI